MVAWDRLFSSGVWLTQATSFTFFVGSRIAATGPRCPNELIARAMEFIATLVLFQQTQGIKHPVGSRRERVILIGS